MPFGMSDYVQSVVMQGRLYVGGGFADSSNTYVVMEYDIGERKWTTLLPYRVRYFAMAVVNKQLVLVGGEEHNVDSKVVGVWRADWKRWTHPYPQMPTARRNCSVVVYNEWLVAAGGEVGRKRLSRVEILNTYGKQWYTGLSTPAPWDSMKTALVGDMGYFMGGRDVIGFVTMKVYCLCIPTLLLQIRNQDDSDCITIAPIWEEIPELELTTSTPLSIGGSLLAVGGRGKVGKAVTAIHLYQPDSGGWVKVGDLPSPRCDCACITTTDWEVLVAGGSDGRQWLKEVDVALIH